MSKLKYLFLSHNIKFKIVSFFLNKYHKKEPIKKASTNFSSLSPLTDIKDTKSATYFNALDYALSDSNIHNIAITGTYGAGKSSVIDSYFKNLNKDKLLKISLATFFIKKEDSDSTKEEKISKIEKSILQQIFYRKRASFFHFSRFKRIKAFGPIKIILFEICLIATFLFLILLFNPGLFDKFINLSFKYSKEEELKDFVTSYLKIFGLVGFAIIGFFITRFCLKFRLTKFTFQKMEFGLDEIKDESLLNKYIDELLYFFEITSYDTVVFEDLDRFNEPEIFFHLRELNTIINNYERIRKKKKVVFIYALKDELFDDVDRAKFFEFIVPIVPVIDTHNSKIIMLEKQNQIQSFAKVDPVFINQVSNYIKDMRLLLNCINEFQIYDEVIESSNKTKLFALILYKNFYPKDFAELNNEKIQKEKDDATIKVRQPLKYFLLNNDRYKISDDYIYNISRYYYRDDENKENDKEFLYLVENNKNPDFTKKLDEVENVISKIKNKKWWNNYAILNNQLLDYLLDDKKDYFEENLDNFIATMYSYDKYHFKNKFFSQYIAKDPVYVKDILNSKHKYFFEQINKYIQSNNDLSYEVFLDNFDINKEKKDELLFALDEYLLVVDSFDDKLKKFVKERIDFLTPAWAIVYAYFKKVDSCKHTKELGSFINNKKKDLIKNPLDKKMKDEMEKVGYSLSSF